MSAELTALVATALVAGYEPDEPDAHAPNRHDLRAAEAVVRVLTDDLLLAELHRRGVLHRQTRRLHKGGPRELRHATVEPDGRVKDGDGMATEWEAVEDA